jgi:hypothetical protein
MNGDRGTNDFAVLNQDAAGARDRAAHSQVVKRALVRRGEHGRIGPLEPRCGFPNQKAVGAVQMGDALRARQTCQVEDLVPHEDPRPVAGEDVVQAPVDSLLIQPLGTVRIARVKNRRDHLTPAMRLEAVQMDPAVQVR